MGIENEKKGSSRSDEHGEVRGLDEGIKEVVSTSTASLEIVQNVVFGTTHVTNASLEEYSKNEETKTLIEEANHLMDDNNFSQAREILFSINESYITDAQILASFILVRSKALSAGNKTQRVNLMIQSLQDYPDNSYLLFAIARGFFYLGQFETAAEYCKKSLDVDLEHKDAFRMFCDLTGFEYGLEEPEIERFKDVFENIKKKSGSNVRERIDLLEDLLDDTYRNLVVLIEMAQTYLEGNMYESAFLMCKEVLKRNPNHVQAASIFKTITGFEYNDEKNTDVSFLDLKAEESFRSNDFQKAQLLSEKVLQINPFHLNALMRLLRVDISFRQDNSQKEILREIIFKHIEMLDSKKSLNQLFRFAVARKRIGPKRFIRKRMEQLGFFEKMEEEQQLRYAQTQFAANKFRAAFAHCKRVLIENSDNKKALDMYKSISGFDYDPVNTVDIRKNMKRALQATQSEVLDEAFILFFRVIQHDPFNMEAIINIMRLQSSFLELGNESRANDIQSLITQRLYFCIQPWDGLLDVPVTLLFEAAKASNEEWLNVINKCLTSFPLVVYLRAAHRLMQSNCSYESLKSVLEFFLLAGGDQQEIEEYTIYLDALSEDKKYSDVSDEPVSSEKNEEVRVFLERVSYLLRDGYFVEASSLLNTIDETNILDNDLHSWFDRLRIRVLSEGDDNKKLDLMVQNLEKDPQNSSLLSSIICQLRNMNKIDQALQYCVRWLAFDSVNHAALKMYNDFTGFEYGSSQSDEAKFVSVFQDIKNKSEGDFQTRIDLLKNLSEDTNQKLIVLAEMAQVYLERNMCESAFLICKTIFKRNPNHSKACLIFKSITGCEYEDVVSIDITFCRKQAKINKEKNRPQEARLMYENILKKLPFDQSSLLALLNLVRDLPHHEDPQKTEDVFYMVFNRVKMTENSHSLGVFLNHAFSNSDLDLLEIVLRRMLDLNFGIQDILNLKTYDKRNLSHFVQIHRFFLQNNSIQKAKDLELLITQKVKNRRTLLDCYKLYMSLTSILGSGSNVVYIHTLSSKIEYDLLSLVKTLLNEGSKSVRKKAKTFISQPGLLLRYLNVLVREDINFYNDVYFVELKLQANLKLRRFDDVRKSFKQLKSIASSKIIEKYELSVQKVLDSQSLHQTIIYGGSDQGAVINDIAGGSKVPVNKISQRVTFEE